MTIPIEILIRFKTSRSFKSFGAGSCGSISQLVGELANIADYLLAGYVLLSPSINVIVGPAVLQPL